MSNYLDISNINYFDSIFSTPTDASFNSNQYNFYSDVNDSLDELNEPVQDNLKQIQINTYYYKKYKSENRILYFIMIVIIIIIIISFIKAKILFFNDTLYSVIISIILAYSILYILNSLWLIMFKDNKNYDENQHMFNLKVDQIENKINIEKYKSCTNKRQSGYSDNSNDLDDLDDSDQPISYNISDLMNELNN